MESFENQVDVMDLFSRKSHTCEHIYAEKWVMTYDIVLVEREVKQLEEETKFH
jgi:hypothetical protein